MTSAGVLYVLRAHFLNEKIVALYSQLQEDFGSENVFILLDVTKNKPSDEELASVNNLILITREIAEEIDPLLSRHNSSGLAYRVESSIVHAARHIREKLDYRYIWFIEFDVYCKGSFAKALELCDVIECDLLCKGSDKGCVKRTNTSHWCWWDNIFGELSSVPEKDRVGGFLPIFRASKKLIEIVEQNLGKSTGFMEVYIPTLCVSNGLIYETMPPEVFGQFHYRPVHDFTWIIDNAEPNKLYHPVKL